MLKLGTRLISKGFLKSEHTIDDVVTVTDKENSSETVMYRPDPYRVYKTESEIEKEFYFVVPPNNGVQTDVALAQPSE